MENIILSIENCAEKLGISVEDVRDLISGGNLKAIGIKQNMVTRNEIERFIKEISCNTIDNDNTQRYNSTNSIETEDLSKEEFEEMVRRANGEGSVYFNEERNKWCGAVSLGYDKDGKRIRKLVSGDTKESVEKKINDMKIDAVLEQRIPVYTPSHRHPKSDMLFEDYINEYLEMVRNKTRGTTFATKCTTAKHIKRELGGYRMYELDMRLLEKFMNDFSVKKYVTNANSNKPKIERYEGQSTIHNVYNLLGCVIRDAAANGIIEKDYMHYIKEPKSKAVTEKKEQALTQEKFKILKDIIDSQDDIYISLMFYIGIYTGLRPSEIKALKFSDFDYKNNTLSVERTLSIEHDVDIPTGRILSSKPVIANMKNVNPKHITNRAVRTIYVGENVIKLVMQYEKATKADSVAMNTRKANSTEDFIFVNHKYEIASSRYYTQRFKRLLEKHGYKYSDFNLYKFRHTYCTYLMRAKVDLKTVQNLMGDNSPDVILSHYSNMNQEDMDKAARAVEMDLDKAVFGEVV